MAKKKQDRGKKEKKKRPVRKLHKSYEVSGNTLKRKNQTCPKCGPSKFLGIHKDRVNCGNCGYTEFKN